MSVDPLISPLSIQTQNDQKVTTAMGMYLVQVKQILNPKPTFRHESVLEFVWFSPLTTTPKRFPVTASQYRVIT